MDWTRKTSSVCNNNALAIIFAVKRFHQYLYGRKFILVTDHRPLCTFLGQEKEDILSIAAARMQLILSA